MSRLDLVCLVADRDMEATVTAVLLRYQSLGIRRLNFRVIRHPEHDPGCYYGAAVLLDGFRGSADHALVIFDWAFDRGQGTQSETAEALEKDVDSRLADRYGAGWARSVVIFPELEAWVFSTSPHVGKVIGWQGTTSDLRDTLVEVGLWTSGQTKPSDPKKAFEWALRRVRSPRSSSLYRKLAEKVSLNQCEDRAFNRFVATLREWFGTGAGG